MSISLLSRYIANIHIQVGPNAAFLTEKGKLTDIGAWYLNKASTGAIPKGDASSVAKFAGWSGLVAATIFWGIL